MPEAAVQFFKEGIALRLPDGTRTRRWLRTIARKEGFRLGSLTYIFCTDAFLLKLNQEFLHHNTLTDILTFDYCEGAVLSGEIYISVPRVRENAKRFQQPFATELRRVMAHGLLHLAGHGDKGKAEKAAMRLKEEACLSLW